MQLASNWYEEGVLVYVCGVTADQVVAYAEYYFKRSSQLNCKVSTSVVLGNSSVWSGACFGQGLGSVVTTCPTSSSWCGCLHLARGATLCALVEGDQHPQQ